MRGGIGDDTYVYDGVSFTIQEGQTEGNDTVEASATFFLPDLASVFVENLILTGVEAIDGNGNRLGNLLLGNENNNRLSGLGGRTAYSEAKATTSSMAAKATTPWTGPWR